MYADVPIFNIVRVHDYADFLLLVRNLLMFLDSGLFTFLLFFFFYVPLGGVSKQNSGGKRICSVA